MGTSRSAAELNGKLQRYAKAIPGANRAAVELGAKTVKANVMALLGPATGGDFILSGVGRNGAKVGVNYKLNTNGPQPKAIVRAIGPFQFIENDTKPHIPAAKKVAGVRGSRRRRQQALALGVGFSALFGGQVGGNNFARVYVKKYKRWITITKPISSKGKQPWARGVERAKPIVVKNFRVAQTRELTRVFG